MSQSPFLCPPFTPMHQILQPAKGEQFNVDHIVLDEENVWVERWRCCFNAHRLFWADTKIEAGTYAQLTSKTGQIWMTDTPMERASNLSVVKVASGRVLVAGLGIGMVIPAIANKSSVERLVVVEKEPEVIALVEPQLKAWLSCEAGQKLEVIQADIFEYRPDTKFDTIYFDIWPNICGDNLADMHRLHRRFGRWLNRDNGADPWMSSWRYNDVIRLSARSKNQECKL